MSQLPQFIVVGLCTAALAATAGVSSQRSASSNAEKAENSAPATVISTDGKNDSRRKTATMAKDGEQATGAAKTFPPSSAVQATLSERERTEAIREKLQKKLKLQFIDTPLHDVVSFLANQTGVPMMLDRKALDEEGISSDEPINFLSGNENTAEQALNWILEEQAMTWLIRNDVVMVTTLIQAEDSSNYKTRIYDVRNLLEWRKDDGMANVLPGRLEQYGKYPIHNPWTQAAGLGFFRIAPTTQNNSLQTQFSTTLPAQFGGGGGGGLGDQLEFEGAGCPALDYFWIIDLFQNMTSGPWEEIVGDGGTISFFGEGLIIARHSQAMQEEIAQLLKAMLVVADDKSEHGFIEVRRRFYPFEEDEAVQMKLQRPVEVQFIETPLHDTLEFLEDQSNIPIRERLHALEAAGVGLDTPVNLTLKQLPLASILENILTPQECTAYVEDGVLWVTTLEDAKRRLFPVVYDVEGIVTDEDLSELIEIIENETSGPWEEIDGDGGRFSEFRPNALVIRQTAQVHDEVALLLHDLRITSKPSIKATEPKATRTERPANSGPVTMLYPIEQRDTADDLMQAIPAMIAPGSWGKENELAKAGQVIVIRATADIHKEVRDFLAQVERANRIVPKVPVENKTDAAK